MERVDPNALYSKWHYVSGTSQAAPPFKRVDTAAQSSGMFCRRQAARISSGHRLAWQEILAELDCLAREPFAEPDLVETGSFATQNVEVLSDFHFSLPLTFTRA